MREQQAQLEAFTAVSEVAEVGVGQTEGHVLKEKLSNLIHFDLFLFILFHLDSVNVCIVSE